MREREHVNYDSRLNIVTNFAGYHQRCIKISSHDTSTCNSAESKTAIEIERTAKKSSFESTKRTRTPSLETATSKFRRNNYCSLFRLASTLVVRLWLCLV